MNDTTTSYWWKNALFYELYVDKFAGTFSGLTAKLEYLQKLGVTCVHILPHYPSPMVDDGYDISDYRGVRPELGTLDDFKTFVYAAHESGVKVLTDFVLNHTSSQHPWFVEARASKDNPRRAYYIWSETGTEFADSINAFPDIKPSNWIFNEATNDYYYASFYPEQPDLNWNNPGVFREMTEHLDFWMDIGVDGFRLDAVSFLIKKEGTNSQSLPETHEMLKKIRAHVESKHPHVILLAEAGASIDEAKGYFGSGDECQLVYNFPLRDALYLSLKRGDRTPTNEVIAQSFTLPDKCSWATFISNHDSITFFSLGDALRTEMMGWIDPEQKYLFSLGVAMRPASIFADDTHALIHAYELLMSIQAAHVMYYGDEIGMKNGPLPIGTNDTRRCVRGMFDWNEADAQSANPDSLLNAMRALGTKKQNEQI